MLKIAPTPTKTSGVLRRALEEETPGALPRCQAVLLLPSPLRKVVLATGL